MKDCIKRSLAIILVSLTALIWFSCQKKESGVPTAKINLSDRVEADYQSATFFCVAKCNMVINRLFVEYSENWSLNEAVIIDLEQNQDAYSVTVSDLKPGTEYYYRYSVVTNTGTYEDKDIRKFVTGNYSTPVVTTKEVSSVFGTEATVEGVIVFDGGASIIEKGFNIGLDETNLVERAIDGDSFILNLTELEYGTTYYYQAYAVSEAGTGKGEIKQFTTKTGFASFGELTCTDVENTSLRASCELTDDGGSSIISLGFCYSTSTLPSINSFSIVVNGKVGPMGCSIIGLVSGTTYYIRAFCTTEHGTSYSNEVSVTTKLTMPTLNPVTVSDIKPTSIELNSGISAEGDGSIIEKGYCYSTTASPDKNDVIVYVNSSWKVSVEGLKPNTTYYVRSFATTQYGTAFSQEECFTTKDFDANVVTGAYSDVSLSAVSLSGSIECDYLERLNGVWFIYSESASDVNTLITSGTRIAATRTGNALFASADNLKSYTTYHCIAYAIIYDKAFFGDIVIFTTAAVDLGLSVKWAGCNVGASAPEGVGNYYAWGETEVKETYTWGTYLYGTSTGLTKYNTLSNYGTVDNKKDLEDIDNVAKSEWGDSWRLPTNEEWTELKNNSSMTWTTINGVPGAKLTSTINGNSIFFPAVGEKSSTWSQDTFGKYWLSSIYGITPSNAYSLKVIKDVYNEHVKLDMEQRCYGLSVRPVSE